MGGRLCVLGHALCWDIEACVVSLLLVNQVAFDCPIPLQRHAYIDTTRTHSIADSLHIHGEQIYPKDLEARMLNIRLGLICAKSGMSWTFFRVARPINQLHTKGASFPPLPPTPFCHLFLLPGLTLARFLFPF